MKGYVNIPKNIYVKKCRDCGARPIIVMVNKGNYIIKCPVDDNHYRTNPGLIDLEDWNSNNNNDQSTGDYNLNPVPAA